jgi:hypothetical protein
MLKRLWLWFDGLFSSDLCKVCGAASRGHLMCDECAEFNQTW